MAKAEIQGVDPLIRSSTALLFPKHPTIFLSSAIYTYTHTMMEQPKAAIWGYYLVQEHFDMQLEPGIKPLTF